MITFQLDPEEYGRQFTLMELCSHAMECRHWDCTVCEAYDALRRILAEWTR
jgi:hypothetical protein